MTETICSLRRRHLLCAHELPCYSSLLFFEKATNLVRVLMLLVKEACATSTIFANLLALIHSIIKQQLSRIVLGVDHNLRVIQIWDKIDESLHFHENFEAGFTSKFVFEAQPPRIFGRGSIASSALHSRED